MWFIVLTPQLYFVFQRMKLKKDIETTTIIITTYVSRKKIKQNYNYQNMREDYKNYPSTSSGKFWESGSLIMIILTRIAFFFFAQSLEILLRKKCVINAAHRNVYIAHGIDERGLISPYKPPALIRNFPVTCFSCLKSVVKSHIRFWFFFAFL